jgi:hypothetical protein
MTSSFFKLYENLNTNISSSLQLLYLILNIVLTNWCYFSILPDACCNDQPSIALIYALVILVQLDTKV